MMQAYTYGICGPLKLLPSAAVIIDQSYNGGFMAGRIVSIFVAKVKILMSKHKTNFSFTISFNFLSTRFESYYFSLRHRFFGQEI